MQSQGPDKGNSLEEIYQHMIEEVFNFPENEITPARKNFLGAGFSNQIQQGTQSINYLFSQRLINTITAQFQSVLPGAFRITTNPEQCLSCANLQSWSSGRSYYSLFEMKQTNSVWILHLSRSIGEGLASLVHQKNAPYKSTAFIGMREADSLIYLEIGELIRGVFNSIIKLWPESEKINVSRCRHILQLVFLNNSIQEDDYVIIPFQLDNRECSGEFHLVFPQKHILSI